MLRINSASVVSGLGGAFLHPSHTTIQELAPQALYPVAKTSRQEVATQIFDVRNIITGGYVWLFGVIIALVIYLAATIPHSSSAVVDELFLKKLPHVSVERLQEPTGLFTGLSALRAYPQQRADLKPFGSSLLIVCSLVLGVAAILAGRRYSKRLLTQFKRARKRHITMQDYLPVWMATAFGVALPGLALWRYGTYPASHLASDVVFTCIILVVMLGTVGMACSAGSELQRAILVRIGFAALGAWHGILQLCAAFLLVRLGNWDALILALISTYALSWVGTFLASRNLRWPLLLAWLAYAGVWLALLLYTPPLVLGSPSVVSSGWMLLPIIVAGGLGALMTCIWYGWYLAVALAFNAHNSEAGGAARIERFKEFMRIRLTPNDLTAYVIAVDDPQANGPDLQPKIVDVFQLHV